VLGYEWDRNSWVIFLSSHAYFVTNTDLVLAALFATFNGLRGTVDLFVWWVTFSIGPKDFKNLYYKIRRRWKKHLYLPEDELHVPLINKGDSIVNRSLRRLMGIRHNVQLGSISANLSVLSLNQV